MHQATLHTARGRARPPAMPRWTRWLAVLNCAVCLLLAAAGLAVEALNRATGHSGTAIYPGSLAIALLFPVVGALIVWRQPGNPIGWVYCGMALSECLTAFTQPYAYYALVARPGSVPAGALASWLDVWVWVPGFTLIAFLLLLFPTGHLLSPGWRWVAWLVAVTTGGGVLVPAIATWSRRGLYLVTHANGVTPTGALGVIAGVGSPLLYGALLAAVVSLALRLHRARGIERQQLKWFAFAAALAAIALVATIILNPDGGYLNGDPLNDATTTLQFLGFAAIPISVGVAILRHRLYDIDVLINRTLVYGSLTAILAAVYFGCVAAMQVVATRLSGETSLPPPAVVATTLLIAALFTPLRRRIQSTIDHRFYRSKYDAARTLAAFGQALRNEMDLPRLNVHLLAAIEETMQPAHVSLWLREHDVVVARRPSQRGAE